MHERPFRRALTLTLACALALVGCVTLDGDPDESTAAPDDGNVATTPSGEAGANGDADAGQGQGQDQGQNVNVSQDQVVIVNVGPTPTAPAPTTTTPTPPPTPTPDAPRIWPTAGSHVAYEVAWHDVDAGATTRATARAEWTHDGSDWRGTCVANERTQRDDGSVSERTITTSYTASDPPHWPLFNTRQTPQVGGPVDTWHLHVCAIVSGHHQYAGEDVVLWDGKQVAAHVGVEEDAQRAEKDLRTEWDQRTGLVLRWDLRESDGDRLVGELTTTDAPLAFATTS